MQVLRSYLRWRVLPVIVVTGTTDDGELDKARGLGIQCAYDKTQLDMQKLVDCAEHLLKHEGNCSDDMDFGQLPLCKPAHVEPVLDLPRPALPPELAHRFAEVQPSPHVALGELAAIRVDGELRPERDHVRPRRLRQRRRARRSWRSARRSPGRTP